MSRAALTLPLAFVLAGATSPQAATSPVTATMSDEAKIPAPKVPAPAPFQKAKGLTATELDPYRDVLAAADLAKLAQLSDELFSSPLLAAFREVVAGVADNKKREAQYALETEEKDVLFTYSIPNDPQLLLGAGKSRGGKVTALPRLVSGALDRRPKPPAPAADDGDGDGDGLFENFLLRNPEQVCTAGLSYSLNPDGSGFAGIEYMPPPLPMDDPLMRMLLFIQNNPNPIFLTEDDDANPLTSDGGPEAEAAVAASGSDAPETADYQPEYGGPWGSVLKRARLGEIPLTDLAQAFAARRTPEIGASHVDKLGAYLRALADAAPGLKKACLGAGNRWTEVRRLDGDLNLMSCLTPSGEHAGLAASVTGEDFPWAGEFKLQDFDQRSEVGLSVAVDTTEMAVRVTALKGAKGERFGPELTYDADGPAVALNFIVPDEYRGKWGEFDVYEWHGDGALKLIGHRKGGDPVDERSYYADGTLAGHVTYADGGRLSSYREWYQNRLPAEETFFDKDGAMSGIRRWWHLSGHQAGEITYAGGRPDGALVMWYDNGKAGVRAAYKNGDLDGRLRWSYEDGGALYEGKFAGNKPDGLVKVTLASGVVVSERTFRQGEPEGTWITYDANGKSAQEFAFRRGQKDGKSVVRYPDGQTAVELVWKDGQLEGPLNSYYQNGQIAATCNYEHDRLVAFSRYHKTGEPAMDGKVLDQERGLGQFTTFRVNGTPIISCGLDNWEPSTCRVFNDKGNEMALPSYRTLTASIDTSPEIDTEGHATGRNLRWHPESCGGYDMKMNFDPIIDYGQDMISVDISTKQPCKGDGLAEVLYCSITIDKGQLRNEPCSMGGADEGDLQEIISEMDPAKLPSDPDAQTSAPGDGANDDLAPAPQSGHGARPPRTVDKAAPKRPPADPWIEEDSDLDAPGADDPQTVNDGDQTEPTSYGDEAAPVPTARKPVRLQRAHH